MDPKHDSGDNCEVSVILPALDEEITIGECIKKIQAVFNNNNINGEIIVADSSTDKTAEIAQSLGARIIRPENSGYGNAYIAAFPFARGRCIVMGDADNTYDFLQIPTLLAPLQKDADFVIGSRFKGEIQPGSMAPLHRHIGNPLLTWMINVIFHTHYSDAHSGFRAITREALEKLDLKSGGMEFASEMLIAASRKNLRISEVPISYYPRVTPSKLHSFADGWRHIRFVMLIKPWPFLVLPGLVFSLLGFFLMAVFLLYGDVESSHLHSFILGAILLVGGLQILFTAVKVKTYAIVHGYETKRGLIGHILNYHSLEGFLVIGGLLFVIGLVIGLNILFAWYAIGFGTLSQITPAIESLVLITTGIQIGSSSLFLSMMLLNEEEEE